MTALENGAKAAIAAATLACTALTASLIDATTAEAIGAVALLATVCLIAFTVIVYAGAQLRLGRGPWLAVLAVGLFTLDPTGGTAGIASAGVSVVPVLLGLGAVLAFRGARDLRTPWQRLGGQPRSERAQAAAFLPLATGTGLYVLSTQFDQEPWLPDDLWIVAIRTAVVIGVLLLLEVALERGGPDRDVATAAHLHDSVLQDLAHIKRNADDPEAVRTTVRTAERDLRDWLAGRSDPRAGDSLTDALRVLGRGVEDEYPGAEIEVVTVGELPSPEGADELLDATREALRNAVRHGGGRANLFAETRTDGTLVVYVRDTGPGFGPNSIPNERRGVRDSIVGRMRSVGGSAIIDSSSDGTEVTLTLPAP